MEGAQQSPTGSPTAGAVPVMDENELARRMILGICHSSGSSCSESS